MSFGAVEGLFSTSTTSPGRSATSSRDMFVAVRDSSTDVYCKQMLILRSWTFRRCVERYKGGCGGQGCLPSHTTVRKEGIKEGSLKFPVARVKLICPRLSENQSSHFGTPGKKTRTLYIGKLLFCCPPPPAPKRKKRPPFF